MGFFKKVESVVFLNQDYFVYKNCSSILTFSVLTFKVEQTTLSEVMVYKMLGINVGIYCSVTSINAGMQLKVRGERSIVWTDILR